MDAKVGVIKIDFRAGNCPLYASVAQVVEQQTENLRVESASLSQGTTHYGWLDSLRNLI